VRTVNSIIKNSRNFDDTHVVVHTTRTYILSELVCIDAAGLYSVTSTKRQKNDQVIRESKRSATKKCQFLYTKPRTNFLFGVL